MNRHAILIALVLLQPASLQPARMPLFDWWIADPLTKVRPQDPEPPSTVNTVSLSAGRNEFEPFQIVLHPDNGDATDLDVAVSDFLGKGSARIPSDCVTVYVERFVNLEQGSSSGATAGQWPDALVPRIDRYTGERRNAFPLSVPRGMNQPLWIEVYVPESAAPGAYASRATISQRGVPAATIPIHLFVWNFSLPSTETLKTSFGLNGTSILKQHRGQYTSDAELYQLTQLYAKAALWHRISIHGGSMTPPRFTFGSAISMDWHSYDAEVGPFLDGRVFDRNAPLPGARANTVELRLPGAFENSKVEAAYYAAWARHFQEKGWSDRLFLYLWDEPQPRDFSKVMERGYIALQAVPELRTLLTMPFSGRYQDVVRIWVPLVNCLEPRPSFAAYCADTPPFSAYAAEAQHGKSLWFYQSCASHGCTGPGSPYFTGWPSYLIDAPGAANRVMQWIAWKYGIEGELYYSMNEAYAYPKDPWTNLRLSGGNGDGTLFYPGTPKHIGGHTDIPIESIRLKLIREGLEDYEYLAILAKLDGDQAAQLVSRIVTAPYQWESKPGAFLQVRHELGDAIDRLNRLHGTGVSHAQ